MANKIDKDIDKEILTSLALGQKGCDIAKRLNVSTAYISQLRKGKKTHEELEDIISRSDYSTILHLLDSSIVDKKELADYAEEQFKEHVTKAKMWQYIHEKIMEEIKCN